MIERSKVLKRLLLCLFAALVISIAAAPVIHSGSGIVWAKSSKKNKIKKKNGLVKHNGHWYYMSNGKKKTGWVTVGKRKYYGIRKGSDKGQLVTGWYTIKGQEYYFRTEGRKGVVCSQVLKGTVEINGISCVFDAKGQFKKCKYAGSTDGFVNTVGEMARLNQVRNNILASLVTAQACLETGFGKNIYCNNLFGIRAGSGYRAYGSWQESMDDYVNFMHTYIPSIFGVRDSGTACGIIGRAGYAEAGGYGNYLNSIVAENDLTRFNR